MSYLRTTLDDVVTILNTRCVTPGLVRVALVCAAVVVADLFYLVTERGGDAACRPTPGVYNGGELVRSGKIRRPGLTNAPGP